MSYKLSEISLHRCENEYFHDFAFHFYRAIAFGRHTVENYMYSINCDHYMLSYRFEDGELRIFFNFRPIRYRRE